MSLKKIFSWATYLFLFFLPWQTRWIYDPIYINGGFFEYASGGLYGTEILLWIILIIFFIDWFRKKEILRDVLPQSIFKMQLSLWGGGVVQGILAIEQFFSQHVSANKWLGLAEHDAQDLGAFVIESGDERWLRAYGSFGSPNALGIYLAVLLVLGLFIYLKTENFKYKIFITIGQLFILSGLILSFSRGAWIATVAGIFLLVIVFRKNKFKEVARQSLSYFLIIIFFFLILRPLFITRIDVVGRLETRSITERVSQIAEWKNIFFTHPILGVGLDKYTLYLHNIHPSLPVWQYQPVHNVYLLGLAEIGILGMIVFLVIWFFFFKFVWQKNISYLPIFTTLLIAGLFDHWLWSMFTGFVFWWVIFLLCIPSRNPR